MEVEAEKARRVECVDGETAQSKKMVMLSPSLLEFLLPTVADPPIMTRAIVRNISERLGVTAVKVNASQWQERQGPTVPVP